MLKNAFRACKGFKRPLDKTQPAPQNILSLPELQSVPNTTALAIPLDSSNVRIMIRPSPRQRRKTHEHTNHPTSIIRAQDQTIVSLCSNQQVSRDRGRSRVKAPSATLDPFRLCKLLRLRQTNNS